ncbi:Calponin-homology (CH) domain-containing protein [Caenorhabditis elegans]|uniref:Calponin-homology (CH) domain-containing protein n=1 Tax=Caenorhabditis elegans TaxID=6239 RepID=Q17989_CAEEL|nr:Calponin-homology (CH) domain-containing protein [Caenorhabditis elegans]CCD64540.1 Calponin-homology (CH) domain-containing protein [Caenorhabditis elegans]|eukprot:NP_509042.1 Leucine-rich Repeats (LRR) and Calponin Homology (CH) domain homolog [Caenorhabditis elegans]
MAVSKHRSTSDHDSSEPSVSRSTTSTGSIHFGQTTSYTSTLGGRFKEAEYSGRLLLHGLRLSEFPIEAFSNIALLDTVFLDLHDNRMSTLPADFSAFDCLISCIASSNRFRTIPTCICSLEQLTFIDFSSNDISHLPDGLFDLPLKALILANNKITCIPEGIRRLAPTLAHLDFSKNDIRSLQSQLRYLTSLEVLKISRNRVEDFPAELCSSLKLRTLDLSHNNLSYLPADFVKMTDLRYLQLECNPLRSPSMDIIEMGIVHIFKWLDGRTSACSTTSNGSNDVLLDRKRTTTASTTIVAEKHPPHNESRATRNPPEPVKHVQHDHRPVNGNLNHRPKELVESRTITSVHAKSHNVQIVQNKISSVPSHLPTSNGGKENLRQSTPDEQNNNNNNNNDNEKSKLSSSSLSSPGMGKKPISKVAPMPKPTPRPIATNGNVQTKIGTVRRPNPIQSTTVTRSTNTATVKKEIPVKTTKIASAISRRSEEPAAQKIASKPITSSVTNLNKSGLRAPATGIANDVESARKLMREKLGPTFSLNKGDISFSLQLSDGQELCKFINKLHPESISLASSTDSSIATTRSKMNVDRFLQYCRKIGVPETTLCSQMDIISKRNPQKVARTVLTVAKLQQLQSSNSIQC